MSIPEPEFSISAFQLMEILNELQYDWTDHYSSKRDFYHDIKKRCYTNLDTIQS